MFPSVHPVSKRHGIEDESSGTPSGLILLHTWARALSPPAGGMGRVLLARILFWAPLVAVALVLFVLPPATARAAGGLESPGKASLENVFDEAPAAWTEISSAEERVKVFEFLAKQAQGNFENIRTWRGRYSLALRSELRGGPKAPGGRSIVPRLPDTSIQEGQYIYTFTLDQERNAVFWESKPLRVEFWEAATGKPVGPQHLPPPPVERKVYTPRRFLQYCPDQVFQGFIELPGRHELRGRRRALRTAVSEAVIFDPRRFF